MVRSSKCRSALQPRYDCSLVLQYIVVVLRAQFIPPAVSMRRQCRPRRRLLRLLPEFKQIAMCAKLCRFGVETRALMLQGIVQLADAVNVSEGTEDSHLRVVEMWLLSKGSR